MRGAVGAEVDKVEKDWLEEHPLCTFNEGILFAILSRYFCLTMFPSCWARHHQFLKNLGDGQRISN